MQSRNLWLHQQNLGTVCFFLPHSANQLHALDLSLFETTRRLISPTNRMEPEIIETEHPAKATRSFVSVVIPCNIIQNFRLSGTD
jgi:hypothetical protein